MLTSYLGKQLFYIVNWYYYLVFVISISDHRDLELVLISMIKSKVFHLDIWKWLNKGCKISENTFIFIQSSEKKRNHSLYLYLCAFIETLFRFFKMVQKLKYHLRFCCLYDGLGFNLEYWINFCACPLENLPHKIQPQITNSFSHLLIHLNNRITNLNFVNSIQQN